MSDKIKRRSIPAVAAAARKAGPHSPAKKPDATDITEQTPVRREDSVIMANIRSEVRVLSGDYASVIAQVAAKGPTDGIEDACFRMHKTLDRLLDLVYERTEG